jgi:hypothetical protein
LLASANDPNGVAIALPPHNRIYEEEVTAFKPFKQSQLELNRRHRLEAIRM